jgi:hypothetical protein
MERRRLAGFPLPLPKNQKVSQIGQITNSRAISSVKTATLQIFRAFRAFRGQKIGCGR